MSALLNVSAVADLVRAETGLPVSIDGTGGNVCTLFAGEFDADGWSVLALGPCWWSPDEGAYVAHTGDVSWGPDDGAGHNVVFGVEGESAVQVAARVVEWLRVNGAA